MFGVSELDYLGHKILAAGMLQSLPMLLPSRSPPPPSIVKELQEFLGMVNFYMRFLPGIAKLWLLMDEMRSGKKGLEQLEWSAAMDATFPAAQQTLLSATHQRDVICRVFIC